MLYHFDYLVRGLLFYFVLHDLLLLWWLCRRLFIQLDILNILDGLLDAQSNCHWEFYLLLWVSDRHFLTVCYLADLFYNQGVLLYRAYDTVKVFVSLNFDKHLVVGFNI